MIEPSFKSNKGQHLVEHSKRDLINTVLYLVKAGCKWHLFPNYFPTYKTVFSLPTYGLIDSQSAKATLASDERGFDGGKKSRGVRGIL